jgi:hypothetical protein
VEYLILWKGYPQSEATWETSDIVEDLQALDEFEERCKSEDKSNAIRVNKNDIKDKWNKNHVSKFIMSLIPPADLHISLADLSNKLKRHKVDGEQLIQLTAEVLCEMGIEANTCEWLIQQLDILYSGESDYPIRLH